MNNGNLPEPTLDRTSINQGTDSSVQCLIHGSRSATRVVRSFEKVDHDGISFDLRYIADGSSDLQNTPPRPCEF
jgi:hypothetical protein